MMKPLFVAGAFAAATLAYAQDRVLDDGGSILCHHTEAALRDMQTPLRLVEGDVA